MMPLFRLWHVNFTIFCDGPQHPLEDVIVDNNMQETEAVEVAPEDQRKNRCCYKKLSKCVWCVYSYIYSQFVKVFFNLCMYLPQHTQFAAQKCSHQSMFLQVVCANWIETLQLETSVQTSIRTHWQTYRHTFTHIPFHGIVEVLWQYKVSPVYDEVLYQHPQGEEQVEASKDVEHNCEPIRKQWHKCPCHLLKGHICTVMEKRDE